MAQTDLKEFLHSMPRDFREALDTNTKAKAVWKSISPLARNDWVCWVTSVKKTETSEKRNKVGLSQLSEGKRSSCCWPGCPHRAKK